jgi:hypothetical protein
VLMQVKFDFCGSHEYQECSFLRCNAGSFCHYFRGEYVSVFSIEMSQTEKVGELYKRKEMGHGR